jgi:hypothetical protein
MMGRITGWFPHDSTWVIRVDGGEGVDVFADENAVPKDAKGLLVSFDLEPARCCFKAVNIVMRDE